MVRVHQYSAYNLHRWRDRICLNQDSDTSITESQMFSTAQYSWRIDWSSSYSFQASDSISTIGTSNVHTMLMTLPHAHYYHAATGDMVKYLFTMPRECMMFSQPYLSEKVIYVFAGYTRKIIILFTTFQVPERHNNIVALKPYNIIQVKVHKFSSAGHACRACMVAGTQSYLLAYIIIILSEMGHFSKINKQQVG